jgi:hypothetical protein
MSFYFSWFLLPFYEAGKAYGKVLGGSEKGAKMRLLCIVRGLLLAIYEYAKRFRISPGRSVGGCATNGLLWGRAAARPYL